MADLNQFVDTILSSVPTETQRIIRELIDKKRLDYSNSGRGYALGSEISFKYDPTKVWRGWLSFEMSKGTLELIRDLKFLSQSSPLPVLGALEWC